MFEEKILETENQNPTHRAYSVRHLGEDQGGSVWTDIGTVWEHEDGKGYSIHFNDSPENIRLVFRPI